MIYVLVCVANQQSFMNLPEQLKKSSQSITCWKMSFPSKKLMKISSLLNLGGASPVMINSADFSAQERKRLYWTNIPIADLPERNTSVLRDIMVDDAPEKDYYNKPFTYHGNDKRVIATLEVNTHDLLKRVYNPDFKCATLTCVNGGYQEKKVWDNGRIRKLTPVEYERLQTLPDGFTEGYRDNVRRSLCGNGWTKEVIKHIFKGLITINTSKENDNGKRSGQSC